MKKKDKKFLSILLNVSICKNLHKNSKKIKIRKLS